ncbi:MAG: Beta-hexosaminidase [Phycisphaerae bacterium]|nr:Beta-hexosaminidase [Phycisphaerae bacterium]
MTTTLAVAITLQALTVPQSVAQEPPAIAVIPRPAELRAAPGTFRLTAPIVVAHPAGAEAVRATATLLAEQLALLTGLDARAQIAAGASAPATISLRLDTREHAAGASERYELSIGPEGIVISSDDPAGTSRGGQTLVQIVMQHLPDRSTPHVPDKGAERPTAIELPSVVVRDQPRYRWRGMLLDCGRHFVPKELIKRYIDLLALHRMNVLHWHLTEDQGWRIEIKAYPRLTEIGAWRRATRDSEQPRDSQGRYGGFYTQDDVREVVAYAAERFITVVPEIEMPGHSQAALAAYPQFSCTGGPFEVQTAWGVEDDVYCAGNDETFQFLEAVLSEVIELFPSRYIHVGGDECPKQRWKQCDKCQARMKAEGLKDEHELQSYFIRRIERVLERRGRRLIGWDEILEGGLAPNATVQSWRGMDGAIAAARSGHDVISSPTSHCYLDYAQGKGAGEPTNMGFLPLERCYEFEPTPADLTPEQARHVLGLEGNMWTEHAPPDRLDWQLFPRLCALAEVSWAPKEVRDWAGFQQRLTVHLKRLERLGVRYYQPQPDAKRE